MPKRKTPGDVHTSKLSVSSLDAAFDILASDTFSKIDHLVRKFEAAAKMQLNDGVAKSRWEEACKRYWVTKAMEDLCCGAKPRYAAEDKPMEDSTVTDSSKVDDGRPLPPNIYPGPAVTHKLSSGEELEWRKWTPKVGDLVVVDLMHGGCWPGKIIDRRTFFQGRTTPRGNHFFPVRVYCDSIEPVITVKSRLIPFDLRPDPPLLAPTAKLTAFNHARHPLSFDTASERREKESAAERCTGGVVGPEAMERIRSRKDAWNAQVNWVMNERRVEKLRNLNQDREKRLREVAKEPQATDDVTCESSSDMENRKRNCPDREVTGGIFALPRPTTPSQSDPLMNMKAASSTPTRPHSPRRLDKRRNGVHIGIGEYSPRGRGISYTPPRILPSGDETAPLSTSPSPVPSSLRFDFVSPLGPVREGVLAGTFGPRRSGSFSRLGLEAVKEEILEDDGESEWTVVQRRPARSGSAPCQGKNRPAMDVELT